MSAALPPEYAAAAEAMEKGLPIEREPFAAAARLIGASERALISAARDMRASGLMRRFGAFFDYRRLGFKGCLFGAEKSPEAAGRICAMPSVTHAYGRGHRLGFWFTALSRGDSVITEICSLLRDYGLAFVALETAAAIKLRPSFVSRAPFPERQSYSSGDVTPAPGAGTMELARAFSGEMEIVSRPFDIISERSGIKLDELLRRAASLAGAGVLRRIGASFDHRRAGWGWNSLCAAAISGVSPRDAAKLAEAVSGRLWASHCYIRNVYDRHKCAVWPYNLYVMIHAASGEALSARENILRDELADFDFVSLRTEKEYKKTSFSVS